MSIEVKDAPDTAHQLHTAQQLRETVHDMRRPVAAMLALAAAAPTEADLPAAAHSRLEQIVGPAEWLVGIIHGCLAWQEREGPDQTGQPDDGSVDVVPVVTGVVAAERVTWPGEVTLTSPTGPAWCMLHPLLRRFVSNVLVNSTRAAGPAGKVAVDIRRRKGAVVRVVEDNAPGFGRIPSGAGLGLSAVARNVVKHGGRMECGGVHASCRLYRQSIGRDRVWRDGLSSRFKCGVPGPEGCVAIVRQVCSPGRYTGTKLHRASVIQRADPVGRRRVRQMGICQT